MSISPENPNLSGLDTFEAAKQKLGIYLSGAEALYRRTSDERIVLFRGQETDYPDALRIGTDGQYGPGTYFGNSPVAVSYYTAHGGSLQGVQAYLLPELAESAIERTSHHAARRHRHEITSFLLQLFPVGLDFRAEQRVRYNQVERSPKQLWARMPVPGAEAIITGTRKLAYLGRVGIGKPRFSRSV